MIGTLIVLALCGMAGALTYSVPLYIRAVSKIPPTPFALTNLIFSVFVGCVTAILFTRMIGHHWPWTVQPEPWPLAMMVGLGSNPLVPIVLRRLEAFAETFGGKTQ
jgi:drug/metabolite transporter (DMT)-like permease